MSSSDAYSSVLKTFFEKEFCLIPVGADKKPITEWKKYQDVRPSWDEIQSWEQQFNYPNFAVLNGTISKGLVVLDFEREEDARLFFPQFDKLQERTTVVKTVHGGIHVYLIETEKVPDRRTKIFGKDHEVDLLGNNGYSLIPGSTIDHSKCDKDKPCDHKSKSTYELLSPSLKFEKSQDIEKTIRERALELGWITRERSKRTTPAIDEIIEGVAKKNPKFADLHNGVFDSNRYPSRSEAEQAEVTILTGQYLSDDQIKDIMDNSKIGKWQEKDESYKNLTIQKAREFLRQKNEGRGEESSEEAEKNPKLNSESWFNQDDEWDFTLTGDDFLRVYPNTVTEYRGTIHTFIRNRYLLDSEPFIKSELEREGKIEPMGINKVVEYIRNVTRVTDPSQIDLPLEQIRPLPDNLIPLEKQGLLDTATKNVLPHDPKYYYVSFFPRNYVAGGRSITFRKFLETIFKDDPDKEVKIIQIYETIAWIISPGYLPHGAVFWVGQGGEGKSIIHLILGLIIVNYASLTVHELEYDKFKRAELYGKYANLVSEAGTDLVNSEWFKKTSDGTVIAVDRKNNHPFLMSSRAKWVVDTNKVPPVDDQTIAFFRRVIAIIEFKNYLESTLSPQEINEYVKKLSAPNELDLIFSEVIDEYYAPFRERLKFTGQFTVEKAKEEYIAHSDPAYAYIDFMAKNGNIMTDITAVQKLAAEGELNLELLKTTDKKTGEEYLVSIKNYVLLDARKWAQSRGLPTEPITTKSIGYALERSDIINVNVQKKVEGSTLRAWKDIFINLNDNSFLKLSNNSRKTIVTAPELGAFRKNEPSVTKVLYSPLQEIKSIGREENGFVATGGAENEYHTGRKPVTAEFESTVTDTDPNVERTFYYTGGTAKLTRTQGSNKTEATLMQEDILTLPESVAYLLEERGLGKMLKRGP